MASSMGNGTDFKLIPCVACNMFKLSTHEEYLQLLKGVNPGLIPGDSDGITMTCQGCIENERIRHELDILRSKV